MIILFTLVLFAIGQSQISGLEKMRQRLLLEIVVLLTPVRQIIVRTWGVMTRARLYLSLTLENIYIES